MEFSNKAIEVRQGGRVMYGSAMTMKEVDELLPFRLEEEFDAVTETNRPIDRKHVERIVNYVDTNPAWVLPTIILSGPEDAISFVDDRLVILGDVSILDGQHRRMAIRKRINYLRDSGKEEELNEFLEASLPFCLIVESSLPATRQIFADIANSKPIDRLTRLEFDGTDPFNNVARQVVELSEMLSGRIHPTKGSSVRTSEEYLMSKTDVKTAVTIVAVGLGKSVNAALRRYHRTAEKELAMAKHAITFFDEFLPEARDLLRDLRFGGIDRLQIGLRRTDNWDLEPIFINLFAGMYHSWVVDGGDEDFEPLALYLQDMDMTREDPAALSEIFKPTIDRSSSDPTKFRPLPIRNPIWREVSAKICKGARDRNRGS